MGKGKVYFSNEDAAHDFNSRIGAGGVELEENGVSVNTDHAKYDGEDHYGMDHNDSTKD